VLLLVYIIDQVDEAPDFAGVRVSLSQIGAEKRAAFFLWRSEGTVTDAF
jgi:hypothetical protein